MDDATRIRALKVDTCHSQIKAIDFINHVVDRFPFRIHTVQTDNGHAFQAKFHWHCEDLGMRHVYIKPRTPRLNGKVESSHSRTKQHFINLLAIKRRLIWKPNWLNGKPFIMTIGPMVASKDKLPMKYSNKN